MRVLIAQPHENAPSETFLSAQATLLPADVSRVYGLPARIEGEPNPPGTAQRIGAILRHAPQGVRPGRSVGAWANTCVFLDHLDRLRPDVVLAQYGTYAVHVLAACGQRGIPLVAHFHGYDASRRRTLDAHRASYAKLFRSAAACVAVSHAMRLRLIDLGAAPERVVVNPCGVDIKRFDGGSPGSAAPVLLSVGRFVAKKAPQLTLEAFSLAHQRCPEARLRMLGDGPLLPSCRKRAQALGIADSVTFLGELPHAAVEREMRAARAFVQHSVEAPDGDCEGTPVSILEAGATGLPVIATRHGGISDAVQDGVTGRLCEEGDVAAMAEHMLEVCRDADLAERQGAAARRFVVSRYALPDRLERLASILREAAKRREF